MASILFQIFFEYFIFPKNFQAYPLTSRPQKWSKNMLLFYQPIELGAVQKYATPVDLENAEK